jgi:hypothetical protein
VGKVERFAGIGIIAWPGRAFIESHDDVGSDDPLDVHHVFGREQVFGPVDMGIENDAVFVELAPFGEGIDLVSAAIGEYGALPAVKFMQPAGPGEDIEAGAEVQMVRVAQDDLRFDVILYLAHVYRFNCSGSTYRHKGRRFYQTVRGGYGSPSGTTLRIGEL